MLSSDGIVSTRFGIGNNIPTHPGHESPKNPNELANTLPIKIQ